MFRDFKELLSALNAHRVRYLIVGGYAVSLHAEPRATKDLDILIGSTAENSKALFAALKEFGAPLEGMSHKDFMEPGNFFRMGTPPVMVDIMPSISGVDFDQAWQRRVESPVDSDLNVWFISREDLLAAKLAAGRPQDLADASALADAAEQQRQGAESGPPVSDTDEARKNAVSNWLAHRAQESTEHGSQSIEERRAKAVENWKNLQKKKARARDVGMATRPKSEEQGREEQAKDGGKGIAEDPDL